MGLYQTLYFMSLVGGIAGLLSWTVASLISVAVSAQDSQWISDVIAGAVLGGFIGGMGVGFDDRWSGNRVTARRVLSATAVGMLAGAVAGLLVLALARSLGEHVPGMTRVLAWMLAGSFIGLSVGLHALKLSVSRVTHAFAGGLLGGCLGGLLFHELGALVPNVSQILAFSLTGVGICSGVTLAPVVLREGSLVFVSSGDARAQVKFGRSGKEWELRPGYSYLIGSQSAQIGRRETEIIIPDSAIASRHALLFERDGRFYVMRHPEAPVEGYVLKVGPQTVEKRWELRHSDDILVGRTALEFVVRTKSEAE